jgi:hypothetical protein
MNEESLEAIILAIFVIALLAVIFVPFLGFIGYTVYQKSKRNRIRERLLSEQRQLVGSHRWFPVRYASEPRFKTLFKIFPWEGAGIIVTTPGSALFLGQMLSGSPLTLQFAPGNSTLTWLGKTPWPNGAVSWFYFTTTNEKHYFTSETGVLVFGSHKSTKAIYVETSQSFLAHSASRV